MDFIFGNKFWEIASDYFRNILLDFNIDIVGDGSYDFVHPIFLLIDVKIKKCVIPRLSFHSPHNFGICGTFDVISDLINVCPSKDARRWSSEVCKCQINRRNIYDF